MPMPTTRRGRYLHYRARALRRARAYRGARYSPQDNANRRTSRGRDLPNWGKQEPKLYPRYVQRPRPVGFFAQNFGDVPPRHKRFGVRVMPPAFVIPPWLGAHHRDGIVLYQLRRVKSLPPSRQMTWNPYPHPHGQLQPIDYYPFEFYPSGQRSYASLMAFI